MKLDAKGIRHLSNEDWRVLAAVEQGSRNHEVVPTTLITTLTRLRTGSAINQSISTLAKLNLIAKLRNTKYDGYRLTYGGIDYLALHTHLRNNTIYSVGNQIGVGKESDILVVASQGGRRLVLKIHRLGRISFRTVKANRDYLKQGRASAGSWMDMSRLAAMKEFAFMRALRDAGFAVPEPVAQDRHTVVMELIDAFPLRQISEIPDPATLYGRLIEMVLELAKFGLIHGDFNEFNILIIEKEGATAAEDNNEAEDTTTTTTIAITDESTIPQPSDQISTNNLPDQDIPTAPLNPNTNTSSNITLTPILIDFPQMLSTNHPNAEFYFDRDIACIKRFFQRRFNFTSDEEGPFFADAMETAEKWKSEGGRRLDVEVEATGFSKAMARQLERYMKEVGVDGDNGEGEREGGNDVEEVGADGDEAEVVDVPAEEDQQAEVSEELRKTDDTSSQQIVEGLTALNLQAQEDAVPELPAMTATKAPPSKRAESIFSSKTTSSRMSRNPAKVATGWAI